MKISNELVYCAWGDFLIYIEDDPKHGRDIWFLTGLVLSQTGYLYFNLALRFKLLDQN